MENNEKNETKNSENINALDEICKGACMGMDAIHFILDKVDNNDLKEYLNKDYEKYEKIKEQIEDLQKQRKNIYKQVLETKIEQKQKYEELKVDLESDKNIGFKVKIEFDFCEFLEKEK